MNVFHLDEQDPKLKNIDRAANDCLLFESFKLDDLEIIIKNQPISINKFINKFINNSEIELRAKVHNLMRTLQSDITYNSFLVFQSVTWKREGQWMPYILIPITIFSQGTKFQKSGNISMNPLLYKKYFPNDTLLIDKITSMNDRRIKKVIEKNDGRVIYEMYITQFKISYGIHKSTNMYFSRTHWKDFASHTNFKMMDKELDTIISEIRKGKNVYIKGGLNTRQDDLISNILYDSTKSKNKICILNARDDFWFQRYLFKQGVFKFSNDFQGIEAENSISDLSMELKELPNTDVIKRLLEARTNYFKTHNGFKYQDLLNNILRLSKYADEQIVVSKVEQLDFFSVNKIKRSLQNIESNLKYLNITKPSTFYLYDLAYRYTRSKEVQFINSISEIHATLTSLINRLNNINIKYDIHLSTNLPSLFKQLQLPAIANIGDFFEDWLNKDIYDKALTHFVRMSSLVNHMKVFYRMFKISYNTDLLKIDLLEQYSKIFNSQFTTKHVDIINKFLRNEAEYTEFIKQIHKLIDKWRENRTIILAFFDINDNDIESLNTIINSKYGPQLYKSSEKDIKNIVDLLKLNEVTISKYVNNHQKLIEYFDEKKITIDHEQQLQIFKTIRLMPSKIMKYIKSSNVRLSKHTKQQLLLIMHEQIETIEKLDDLGMNFTNILKVPKINLLYMIEVQKTLKCLIGYPFINKIKRLNKIDLSKLQNATAEYIKCKHEIMSDFTNYDIDKLFCTDIETLTTNVVEYEKFLNRLFSITNTINLHKKASTRYISIQEVKKLSEQIRTYQNQKRELEEHKSLYEQLYGPYYTGRTTKIQQLRRLLNYYGDFTKLFNKFASIKTNYKLVKQSMAADFEKLLSIYQQFKVLRRASSIYFDTIPKIHDINEVIKYYFMFLDLDKITKWNLFLFNMQVLRDLNQFKIVALINSGYLTQNIVVSFDYAYSKQMVEVFGYNQAILSGGEYLDEFYTYLNSHYEYKKNELFKTQKHALVDLLRVTDLNALEKKYHLTIVLNVEKICKSILNIIPNVSKQWVFISDSTENTSQNSIAEFISNQPSYFLTYRNNPLVLVNDISQGGAKNVNIETKKELDIINTTIKYIQKFQIVNIVVANATRRINLFIQLAKRLKTIKHLHLLNHLYITLKAEFPIRSDILLLTVAVTKNEIMKYMRYTSKIILKASKKNSDSLTALGVNNELSVLENVSNSFLLWFINKLDLKNRIVKKFVAPFDLAIGRTNIEYLLKIHFHSSDNSDILENTFIMNEYRYKNVPIINIFIDELLFNQKHTISKVRGIIYDQK